MAIRQRNAAAEDPQAQIARIQAEAQIRVAQIQAQAETQARAVAANRAHAEKKGMRRRRFFAALQFLGAGLAAGAQPTPAPPPPMIVPPPQTTCMTMPNGSMIQTTCH